MPESGVGGTAVAIGLLLAILTQETIRRRRRPQPASASGPLAEDREVSDAIAERFLVYCTDAQAADPAERPARASVASATRSRRRTGTSTAATKKQVSLKRRTQPAP
jgi:hypothetical protein